MTFKQCYLSRNIHNIIIFRLVQNWSSLEAVKSHWLSKKLSQDGFSGVWVPRKEIKPFSISWPLQLKPPPFCIGWTFWGGIGFMALCCTTREAFYSIFTEIFTLEKVFILNPCRPLTFKFMTVLSLYGFSKFYWNKLKIISRILTSYVQYNLALLTLLTLYFRSSIRIHK